MEESHESNDAIDNTVIHTQLTEDEPPSDDVTAESPSKNVPKSIQGLEIGGRLPGAFNIRQRATGERPVWVQQEETENALESCHDSSSTRSETSMAIHEIDESCVVIEVAELSKPLDDPILIEGTTVHSKRSRFFLVSGFFTLVIAVAVSVALVTTKITSSATPVSPGQYHDPIHASLSPTSAPFGMQLDWTIADALLHNRGHLVALLAAGRLLIDILNDTDTNYTYFGMVEEATLLANVDSTILSKFLSPYWNGHVLDVLKAMTVKGQALDVEHIQDNMVVTSMAGYPMTLQRNPFQRNNITISSTEQNHIYKNGVIHYANDYPKPLAPWIGKTMYNVLLETNDKRNSDLSDFIAIIETLPSILQLLQDNSTITATTLFVPTNNAIALSNLTWMTQQQQGQNNIIITTAMVQQLVQNHIVSGNFVRSCWWTIPTGTIISESELRLESEAGQSLDLLINDEGVIINGNVRIVEEDIFSEYGIIQIIDTVFSVAQ